MGAEEGLMTEDWIAKILTKEGIDYSFDDDYYDFLVDKKVKLEVKSCRLSVKQKGRGYRSGRWDFTSELNRQLQVKNDVWVCFVARYETQFILVGFCKSEDLKGKSYLTLSNHRSVDLLSFDDWKIVSGVRCRK